MRTIKNIKGIANKRTGLVICPGATVKQYENDIKEFILNTDPVTIGVNNISRLYKTDYHLWTNTKRFRNFGHNIIKDTDLLLGSNISIKVIRDIIKDRKYTLINYSDREGIPIGFKKEKITGHFRTAGCLAIMVLHVMGVSKVNIVGMDGHTINNYSDIKNGIKPHHCYNEKYVPYAKDVCISKDKLVNKILKSLVDYGIYLSILTPTVYKDFKGTL